MRYVTCALLLGSAFTITVLAEQTPKLTQAQAQAIALKLHPGKLKSAELETEHGIQQYSFDIQTKKGIREVGINASSGKVVEETIKLRR